MSRSQRAVVVSTFVFSILSFLTPAESQAQSYAVTVWNQLNSQYTSANNNGYASSKYIIGRLKNSETENWNITLYAGNTYMITGVCDGDCKDIDLALIDSGRKELVSDLSADDVPVLLYDVKTTGTYTVKVTMYSCTQDPCYFGLGIFFK